MKCLNIFRKVDGFACKALYFISRHEWRHNLANINLLVPPINRLSNSNVLAPYCVGASKYASYVAHTSKTANICNLYALFTNTNKNIYRVYIYDDKESIFGVLTIVGRWFDNAVNFVAIQLTYDFSINGGVSNHLIN